MVLDINNINEIKFHSPNQDILAFTAIISKAKTVY